MFKSNSLLYNSLILLNAASPADTLIILLDILLWKFLIIFGGWLQRMLMCNGLLSRNLKTFKFVLQVILRSKSSLKFFIKRFLIQSDWGSLVYSKQADPSWRYKPILCFPTSHPNCGEYINQLPPTIHKSKLPIVTSKSGCPFSLIQISVVLISSSLIFTNVFAYVTAFKDIPLKLKDKILQYQIAKKKKTNFFSFFVSKPVHYCNCFLPLIYQL